MSVDLASQWHVFILFGLVSGFMSALLGIGGGVVLMPLLLLVTMFDPDHARGTALGYMVGTCLVGALTYQFSHGVSLSIRVILLLTGGGIVGAFLGGKVGLMINADWVKRLFAILMVFAAVKMFMDTVGKRGVEGKGEGSRTASARANPAGVSEK